MRRLRYLWLVPPALLLLYVQLAGYPVLPTYFAAFGLFVLAGSTGLFPYASIYGGALALFIMCPLWLMIDESAAIAWNDSVYRMAVVMHVNDGAAIAYISANMAFVFFCAGLFSEALYRMFRSRTPG